MPRALTFILQASEPSPLDRLYPLPHHSSSFQMAPTTSQPKLAIMNQYSIKDLVSAMEALHISRARSHGRRLAASKAQHHINIFSSKPLKNRKEGSTVPAINGPLQINMAIQSSNYKPASVEEADSFASDDETLVSESNIADRDRDEALKSHYPLNSSSSSTSPSGREVRSTTRISRGIDGETKVTGVMSFNGSPLLSPENSTLLKRLSPGVYEKVVMTKNGVLLTENGVETFVPRCLEDTFRNSIPLRRSTPYSVTFSDSTSSKPKTRSVSYAATHCGAGTSNDKAKEGPARTEKNANQNSELPPRAKLEQAYRDQKIANYTLPDKAFFIDCRFSGCWGQSLVLRGCHFNNCRFSHSNIANCRFSNSTIEESILIDCTFSGSNVVGGKVIDCDPSNSHIQ